MNTTTEPAKRPAPRVTPSRYWPTPAGTLAAQAIVRLAQIKLAELNKRQAEQNAA